MMLECHIFLETRKSFLQLILRRLVLNPLKDNLSNYFLWLLFFQNKYLFAWNVQRKKYVCIWISLKIKWLLHIMSDIMVLPTTIQSISIIHKPKSVFLLYYIGLSTSICFKIHKKSIFNERKIWKWNPTCFAKETLKGTVEKIIVQ